MSERMVDTCRSCTAKLEEFNTDEIVLRFFYSNLSPRQYHLLLARYIENMPLEDIAKIYSVRRERIAQIIKRAIHILHIRGKKMGLTWDHIQEVIILNKDKLPGVFKSTVYKVDKDFIYNSRSTYFHPNVEVMEYKKTLGEKINYTEYKDKSIGELGLSLRAHNCLIYSGIKTLGELSEQDQDSLLKIKNLGRKSVGEIIRSFYSYCNMKEIK